MLTHNPLGGFNAFHLRHGDIHQNDVGAGSVIFGNRGATVTGLACQHSTIGIDDARKILPGKDRVIHHEVADWLVIGST
jgi:hypothetical protein